jgi:alkylation response protein AidB-like acyl-CoA dehydrogenase
MALAEPLDVAARASLVDKARELHDVFNGQAEANEEGFRLTDATVKALWDGGFFGMWIPRCFGGHGAGCLEALGVIEQLSYSDGSTGWVLMAAQVGTATAAGYLPAESAKELFGRGQWPVISGQGAPLGTAVPDGDGYRLSGHWHYASGLLHSNWIHTGATVMENGAPRMLPGGKHPDVRIFILPVERARLAGNWDVMGLRATGSVDYVIDNVYVPEEYTHLQSANASERGSIFKLRIFGMGTICHTGFALGVGRRMLDELRRLATAASGRPQTLPVLGGGESFQEQFGMAEAKVRAARAFVVECWQDVEDTLDRGDDPTTRQITLARLALNYATAAIAEVCQFAYRYGGGVALRDSVIQRCFRDMNAGTQHATVGTGVLRECAKDLLGMGEGKIWGPRTLIDP